jgi:hypothetical protein
MPAARRAPPRVTGPASYERLRPATREARFRALEAVSRMRTENLSLTAAARASGTTPATIRRYAAPALTQQGRRTVAKPTDRIYRRIRVLTTDGVREVDIRSSRQASRVGAHWNAVDAYLRPGNTRALRKFTNIRLGGTALATDPEQIEAYARRGELAIDDIYPQR